MIVQLTACVRVVFPGEREDGRAETRIGLPGKTGGMAGTALGFPGADGIRARSHRGLDELRRPDGRDLFRRVVHGTRISLLIGFVVVFVAGAIGTVLGLMAGYFGKATDTVIMRLMDILLAFPGILLAIAIVAVRGAGILNTIIAVAVVGIPGYARVVRSMVLSLRERDYVDAARMIGVSNTRIMFMHILPNSLSPIIVQMTLGVGGAILFAAALGFLGLGVQPPAPEWGAMISDGIPFLRQSPHLVFFPGMAIMLTVLGFNLLGDGLRDALDPQLRD